jgi:L-2,4-diaminobutyrate decarboxylase
MLRTSVLSAAVLVRDGRDLDQAFHEDASYLFHDKEQPGFDFVHRTVECTKAALGLKVFMALAAEGEAALAAYWDRQADLAREAARWIGLESGFELAAEPQANIVCFRVEGDDGRQLAIRKRLVEDGRYYISTTEHGGRRWLRLALMNPETSLGDVQALAAEIRRHAAVADYG